MTFAICVQLPPSGVGIPHLCMKSNRVRIALWSPYLFALSLMHCSESGLAKQWGKYQSTDVLTLKTGFATDEATGLC